MSKKEQAIKLDGNIVKMGRLIHVYNKNGKKETSQNYWIAVQVEDANGKNERCLLFTPEEIKIAEERAKNNSEDIPEKSLIQDIID